MVLPGHFPAGAATGGPRRPIEIAGSASTVTATNVEQSSWSPTVNIGTTADPDRIILLGLHTAIGEANTPTVSMTVGGVTAHRIETATAAPRSMEWWWCPRPTGTGSQSVVVTWSGAHAGRRALTAIPLLVPYPGDPIAGAVPQNDGSGASWSINLGTVGPRDAAFYGVATSQIGSGLWSAHPSGYTVMENNRTGSGGTDIGYTSGYRLEAPGGSIGGSMSSVTFFAALAVVIRG